MEVFMSARIAEVKNSIVFENDTVELLISKSTSAVEKIIDKTSGKDVKREDSFFFTLFTKDDSEIALKGLSVKDDIITVDTEGGAFQIKAAAFDDYFTFEVASSLPKDTYKLHFADAKYDYDYDDKSGVGAILYSMSIWADTVYYPDAKARETRCRVFPKFGDKGAKAALVIAPICQHVEIMKKISLTIDKRVGFASRVGGPWCQEARSNLKNYSIQYSADRKVLEDNVEYFKKAGINQLDMYFTGFRKGDFKQMTFKGGTAEYKENVTDLLKPHGVDVGLHTFTCYIDRNCETFLANPEYQKQIAINKVYTLDEDITDDSTLIKLVEGAIPTPSTDVEVRKDTPFLLIDEEVVEFSRGFNGEVKIVKRAHAGTTKAAHKKGAEVKHIEGYYYSIAPALGTPLFYEIARNHARVYNECDLVFFYLDASDAIIYQCENGRDESWFYLTSFVHEIYKNCKTVPIIESTLFVPSMFGVMGRCNAWDNARRNYKRYTSEHMFHPTIANNLQFYNRYLAPTLGWYDFYPIGDETIGNDQIKYHHLDAVDFAGATAIMYDSPNVMFGTTEKYYRYKAFRRNTDLYKKYDDLRQSEYFSKEYREKMKRSPYELKLIEKRGGKYSFVEKDYQLKLLYDLSDEERNYAEFKNPFGRQTPFLRIEALLSTAKKDSLVLMKFDESFDLTTQKLKMDYGMGLDLTDKIAKTVRVLGNGVKGSKIAIKILPAKISSNYCMYVIDTDFEGWREFVLLECENGERTDHHFEDGVHVYPISRNTVDYNSVGKIEVVTEGDMTGVRMSSIVAHRHTYDVLKNPTVRIKDTSIMFECELQSSDFIEFDGKCAKVIDRYGNEREIYFKSESFAAPRGKFDLTLEARSLNRLTPRAKITLGFTGKEIK